jgi:GTP cyclohydrolase FolE2
MRSDMRSYILTERERKILKRFIESGEKLDGFTVLLHYLKKHRASLSRDFEMVETVLEKVSSNTLNDVADEILRQSEEKEKARLRTRGPYRKAKTEPNTSGL